MAGELTWCLGKDVSPLPLPPPVETMLAGWGKIRGFSTSVRGPKDSREKATKRHCYLKWLLGVRRLHTVCTRELT